MSNDIAIGIDIGTSFARCAVYDNGVVKMVPNSDKNFHTPCFFSFNNGQISIGSEAKEDFIKGQGVSLDRFLRLVGKNKNDETLLNSNMAYLYERDRLNINDNVSINIEEIFAIILTRLKNDAEVFTKKSVSQAVIANYTDHHDKNEMIRSAAAIAGFDLLSMKTATIAEATTFSFYNNDCRHKALLFFDFGGGNVQISLYSMINGINSKYYVVYYFGGIDFTKNLYEYILKDFKKKFTNAIQIDQNSSALLYDACERAKQELSIKNEAVVKVRAFYENHELIFNLNRELFCSINNKLYENFKEICDETRRNVDKLSTDYSLCLLGGSSQLIKVKKIIETCFKKEQLEGLGFNMDEAAAIGAAIIGAKIMANNLRNNNPLPLNNLNPSKIDQSKAKLKQFYEMDQRSKNLNRVKNEFESFYLNIDKLLNQNTDEIGLKIDGLNKIISEMKNNYELNSIRNTESYIYVCTQMEKLKNLTASVISHVYHKKIFNNVFISQAFHKIKQLRAFSIDFGSLNARIGVFINGNVTLIPDEFDQTEIVTFIWDKDCIGNRVLHNLQNFKNFKLYTKRNILSLLASDGSNCENLEAHISNILKYLTELVYNYSAKDTNNKYLKDTLFVLTQALGYKRTQQEIFENSIKKAGIKSFHILSEDKAAVIGYAFQYNQDKNVQHQILFLGIGAGHTVFNLIEINGLKLKEKSTLAINDLGGLDFTLKIMEFCLSQIDVELKNMINNNSYAYYRLYKACEAFKLKVSNLASFENKISVNNIIESIDLNLTISNETVNSFWSELFLKIRNGLEEIFKNKNKISKIVLIGPTTKFRQILKMINESFSVPIEYYDGNIVVEGGAIYAAALNGDKPDFFNEFEYIDKEGYKLSSSKQKITMI